MTDEDRNRDDGLDVASLRILEAIVHEGGEATTTEIRRHTGLDENTVHYRMNKKLPSRELIETHNQGTDAKGRSLPNVSEITDDGEEVLAEQAEKLEEESLDDDRDDRIGELQEHVKRLENRVDVIQQNNGRERREELDEIQERLDQVYEGFLAMREYLRREQDVEDGDLKPYLKYARERTEE